MGFPKYQDSNKIIDIIKKFYDTEFQNIELVISYGSKKPYSDIDLFIVSNNPSRNYFNGWLDIYELNIKDFECLKNNLDISVTDPIFTGIQIYGVLPLEEYQRSILNHEITAESIAHNNLRSKQQKELINKTTDARLIKLATGYSNTYDFNAKELSLGNKLLTLKELENKYGRVR
jgi:predicted nucleotidyltransferase